MCARRSTACGECGWLIGSGFASVQTKPVDIPPPSSEAIQDREDLQDEQSVCSALQFLCQTLCAIDHTAALADPDDSSSPILCKPCKTFDTAYTPPRHKEKERGDAACAFRQFQSITTNLVPQTGPLTVRALILLRRMALHANTDEVLDYEQSDICKWCSAQLYSPDKAVRDQAACVLKRYCLRGLL